MYLIYFKHTLGQASQLTCQSLVTRTDSLAHFFCQPQHSADSLTNAFSIIFQKINIYFYLVRPPGPPVGSIQLKFSQFPVPLLLLYLKHTLGLASQLTCQLQGQTVQLTFCCQPHTATLQIVSPMHFPLFFKKKNIYFYLVRPPGLPVGSIQLKFSQFLVCTYLIQTHRQTVQLCQWQASKYSRVQCVVANTQTGSLPHFCCQPHTAPLQIVLPMHFPILFFKK